MYILRINLQQLLLPNSTYNDSNGYNGMNIYRLQLYYNHENEERNYKLISVLFFSLPFPYRQEVLHLNEFDYTRRKST